MVCKHVSVTQVLESQFPETVPLPFPAGLLALGREDLMHDILSSEGLQNIQIAQVRPEYLDSVTSQLFALSNPVQTGHPSCNVL
jgi:hypothetical protein